MKKLLIIIIFINIFKITFSQEKISSINKKLSLGEKLIYNAYWTFFKIAEVQSIIDSNIFWVLEKPCYKVDINARISNTIRIFSVVDEIFGAYIDTINLKPTTTYRYLREGNYTHDEVCYFDYNKNKMQLTVLNNKTQQFELKDSAYIHKNILDIVSAYINLRSVDFKGKNKGDYVAISFFVEKELFTVNFTIDDFETIKVKAGKFKTIKLIPTIPNNILFNTNYPIKLWLNNNENNFIVKIQAKLKFGNISLELKEIDNLKNNSNND